MLWSRSYRRIPLQYAVVQQATKTSSHIRLHRAPINQELVCAVYVWNGTPTSSYRQPVQIIEHRIASSTVGQYGLRAGSEVMLAYKYPLGSTRWRVSKEAEILAVKNPSKPACWVGRASHGRYDTPICQQLDEPEAFFHRMEKIHGDRLRLAEVAYRRSPHPMRSIQAGLADRPAHKARTDPKSFFRTSTFNKITKTLDRPNKFVPSIYRLGL